MKTLAYYVSVFALTFLLANGIVSVKQGYYWHAYVVGMTSLLFFTKYHNKS